MGRMIGPKTWDRIVELFQIFWIAVTVCVDCLGALYNNLFNKLCFGK